MRGFALLLAIVLAASPLLAQLPVTRHPNQQELLKSNDPKIAANKKLVYDFWREVFEARHMELAEKYIAESYIQHNPNVPTGRKAFIDFFSRQSPQPIAPTIKAPLVTIIADGDWVMLAFAREYPDPKDNTKKYTTTWFDMFRIENGKIAEHWDPATKN